MPSIADYQAQVADAADEPTLQNTNGAVAPAANAVIASVTPARSGLYEITVLAGYGATADVVDNMDLAINGVQQLVLPVIATANALRPILNLRLRVNAGQVVAVRAIAAGGAGSVFRATLVLKRVLD